MPGVGAARSRMVRSALRLVSVSVAFGILSGTVSVATGLHDHSLGVFAVGLDVLADVTGSAVLIWRFRDEQRRPASDGRSETRAAVGGYCPDRRGCRARRPVRRRPGERVPPRHIGRHPGGGWCLPRCPHAAGLCETPTRRADGQSGLQGDGALTGIGAASSLLALTALVLYDTLGWWQADRVAALIADRPSRPPKRGTPHHATEQALETRFALGSARSDERSGLPLNDLAPRFAPHGT
jgi:hypothetical protein